jgi:hypothetical protein
MQQIFYPFLVCHYQIERSRRDQNCKQIVPGTCTCISDKTDLPKTNWRNFLSDRVQKRDLVNFLSGKFLEFVQSKLHDKHCIVVTSGGFEGENKDKTFGSSPEQIKTISTEQR